MPSRVLEIACWEAKERQVRDARFGKGNFRRPSFDTRLAAVACRCASLGVVFASFARFAGRGRSLVRVRAGGTVVAGGKASLTIVLARLESKSEEKKSC